MSTRITSPTFQVPPAKQAYLKQLMTVPRVPWHVLLCLFLVTFGTVTVNVLALTGQISLVWGAILNTVLMYPNFTLAHDSIHRSAWRSQKINDWIGRIGLLFTTPQVTLGLFRWAHVQHHRFTNGPRDPDLWLHNSPIWQLPLRFIFIDVGYLLFVARLGDAVALRHLRTTMWAAAATALVAGALCWAGYTQEVILLWLIPSRIGLVLTGFLFFWLPHVIHDVTANEDVTQASSIRLGMEWLLSPLLLGQNYHLIHHLFPTMPSHRHEAAWRMMEPELRQRSLVIQHGLDIRPTLVHPN